MTAVVGGPGSFVNAVEMALGVDHRAAALIETSWSAQLHNIVRTMVAIIMLTGAGAVRALQQRTGAERF